MAQRCAAKYGTLLDVDVQISHLHQTSARGKVLQHLGVGGGGGVLKWSYPCSCESNILVRATVGLVSVILWDFAVALARRGGGKLQRFCVDMFGFTWMSTVPHPVARGPSCCSRDMTGPHGNRAT